jgi:hypothetical protein
VLDPTGGVLHRLWSEAAAVNAAVDFAAKETSGFENAQAFGNSGKRNVEGSGELGNGGFALCEASEDGAAGGVRECGESGIEERGLSSGIVNHMVYDRT